MAPRDAQMYWLANRIPNDQFLLYCFDGAAATVESVQAFVLRRAGRIGDLMLRVHDVANHLDYPYWCGRTVTAEQIIEHRLPDSGFAAFLEAMGAVLGAQLNASAHAWRLHLFPSVLGAPRCGGPALIAVLQVSHALADGRRSSALARALFGTDEPDPAFAAPRMPPWPLPELRGLLRLPLRIGATVRQGRRAHRARIALVEAAERGEVPAELPGQQLISVNTAPGPVRQVRMVVRSSEGMRAEGITVTVAAMVAIGTALARYESRTGAPEPTRLGAEVTVAHPTPVQLATKPVQLAVDTVRLAHGSTPPPRVVRYEPRVVRFGSRVVRDGVRVVRYGVRVVRGWGGVLSDGRGEVLWRNNFGNVGVELYPDEPDLVVRAGRIAGALEQRRRRMSHPLSVAQRGVAAAMPAPAMWQEIKRLPLGMRPPTMTGNTVVSSVFRGAADLRLGGGTVQFTAGFPALSPAMGLTHGVHGIGDTVTITVVAGTAAVPDLDAYAHLLRVALDETELALRSTATD